MRTLRINSSKSTIRSDRAYGRLAGSDCIQGALILGAALLVLQATACVAVDGEATDDLGSDQYKELTCNGLTPSALAENLPALRAIADRPLIGGAPGLLASDVAAAMNATASGAAVLDYAIDCALDSDDHVGEANGAAPRYYGRMGLAPQWKHNALDASARRALSACMLAHVNAFGVTVPLSVRDYGQLDTSVEEVVRYDRYEATFYGDLFSPTPAMYVCSGDPGPDMSVPYGSHDLTAGDRLLRRCSDESSAGSSETMCGFTLTGACSDVCDTRVEGSHKDCWDSPARDGIPFAETISAWTLGHDDPESVWPALYHEVYGQQKAGAGHAASTQSSSSSRTTPESGHDRGHLAKSSVAKLAGQSCPL